MGGGSSTEQVIGFHNASSIEFTIKSPTNGTQILPKYNTSWSNITFPMETDNYTLTTDSGDVYTLIGSTISTMGYSDIFIYEKIVAGASIYDAKFYFADGKSLSGLSLEYGINVSFNNENIAAQLIPAKELVLTQIDFSSVFIDNNPVDKPAKPDKPAKTDAKIKVPPIVWIAIVLLTFVITGLIVGYIIYKKKLSHSSSNS